MKQWISKLPFFSKLLWFFALTLLSLSQALNLLTLPKIKVEQKKKIDIKYDERCCFLTYIRADNIAESIIFGYSLLKYDHNITKHFALYDNSIDDEYVDILKYYFNMVEYSSFNKSYSFKEMYGWEFKQCSPVVAVESSGLFISNPRELCLQKPFAAAPNRKDILLIEKSLIVIDPSENINSSLMGKYNTFEEFMFDFKPYWNVLPTYFNVEYFEHKSLEFWLKYSSPVFINYKKFDICSVERSKFPRSAILDYIESIILQNSSISAKLQGLFQKFMC